jgi:hypothetical protein
MNTNKTAYNRSENVNPDDVLLTALFKFLGTEGNWQGTMTELSSQLSRSLSRKENSLLPASPSSLRLALNRIINRVRNRGVSVKFGRQLDRNRTRFVRFSL